MGDPSNSGNAKMNEACKVPSIKREYSQRFETMSREAALNNRIGPQVST